MSRQSLRFGLLVALLLVAAVSLVGAQDAVTLRVVGFVVPLDEQGTPLDEAYKTFLANFQEQHPNITIEALETPPEFDTQLLVDLAAGTGPDIWSQDASALTRLVTADESYALDMRQCVELVPELNLDRFFPSVLAIHQREADGPIWGLPNDFTPMVIYYNVESFQKAGLPEPSGDWTWAEFRETAQKLTLDSAGRNSLDPDFNKDDVVQWGFRVRKFVFEWIYRVWQNGSDIISPDGTTASGYLDSPETIEAITWLANLMLVDGVSPAPSIYDQIIQSGPFLDQFLQGKFAMFDRGHWELVGLRANPNYKPGIFKVVGQPGNKQEATVIYESSFFINGAVANDPAKLLAACQFVERATSREYQDSKAISGIALSANMEAAEAAIETSADPEITQVFFDEVQYARPPYGSVYAQWPTIEELINGMMERILAGGDIETEVAAAVVEINRELSR